MNEHGFNNSGWATKKREVQSQTENLTNTHQQKIQALGLIKAYQLHTDVQCGLVCTDKSNQCPHRDRYRHWNMLTRWENMLSKLYSGEQQQQQQTTTNNNNNNDKQQQTTTTTTLRTTATKYASRKTTKTATEKNINSIGKNGTLPFSNIHIQSVVLGRNRRLCEVHAIVVGSVSIRVVIALWALKRKVNSLRWVVGLSFRLLEAISKSSSFSKLPTIPSNRERSKIFEPSAASSMQLKWDLFEFTLGLRKVAYWARSVAILRKGLWKCPNRRLFR